MRPIEHPIDYQLQSSIIQLLRLLAPITNQELQSPDWILDT